MMMLGLKVDELEPLQRARIQRLAGGVGGNARLMSANLERVADWLANSGLPVIVQEDEESDNLREALRDTMAAVATIERQLAARDGQSSGARALEVLASSTALAELAVVCLEIGRHVRRIEAAIVAVSTKAEAVLKRPGELSLGAPYRMRRRLAAGATALNVDSVWLEDQVQRLSSETLNKSQANVARVQRTRQRKKEGLSTVTTHYSFSDLNALRVLGFLKRNSPPYSKEDVTAAFEAFVQAALTIASYSAELTDEDLQNGGAAWDETRIGQWADRLAALARVRKAGEVKAED